MKLPRFDQQVVRDDDADRTRLASTRQLKRHAHRVRDGVGTLHGEDLLGDRPQQRSVVQAVDLERAVMRPVGDIADDADDGDAIEQGFAEVGERIGQAWPGHDAEDTGLAGGAGIAVGHGGGGELMRDEEVAEVLGLEGIPQLIFLGAGDAVDAVGAFLDERLDERLGPAHLAMDAGRRLAQAGIGGDAGDAGDAAGARELEQVTAIQIHAIPRGWVEVQVHRAGARLQVSAISGVLIERSGERRGSRTRPRPAMI